MKDEKRQYKTIDFFKLISALLVVLIHTNELHAHIPDMLVFSLSQFAVPFFFIVSGYFFYKGLNKTENQREFLWKYVVKQLSLYFLWQIVILYTSINSYIHMYEDRSALFITLVILRRILICGGSVYWYILILAESAIVIYFLGTSKRRKFLYFVICLGLVLGFIYDNRTTIALFSKPMFAYINKAFYTVFSWSNNFVMKGVPFMGIGYIFAGQHTKYSKEETSFKVALIGLLLATVTNFFLFIFGRAIYLMFVVQAVSVFIICITHEIEVSSTVAICLRELSSCIYFVHTLIIYRVIDSFFGLEWNIILRYVTTVLLSCIVYYIVKFIIKKHDIILLRFMFNIRSVVAQHV